MTRPRCVRVFRLLGTLKRNMTLVLKFRAVQNVTGFLLFPMAKETRMWIVFISTENFLIRLVDVARCNGNTLMQALLA